MRSTSGWALAVLIGLSLVLLAVWTRYLWGTAIITTVVARQGHLNVMVSGTAILVRNERLFASPLDGSVVRQVAEGTLVIPGTPVIRVDGSRGEGPAVEVQIEYLRASAGLFRSENQAVLGGLREEGHTVVAALQDQVASLKSGSGTVEDFLAASIAYASWQERWTALWSEYEGILLELERLGMWLGSRQQVLESPVRGFVTYRYDGLEEVLRLGSPLPGPSRIAEWNQSEVRTVSDGDPVQAGRIVFRVASAEELGFYLPVEAASATAAQPAQPVTIVLPTGRELPARLEYISPPEDGKVGILLVTDRFLADLAMPRHMDITIRFRRVSGVILPSSSVVMRGGQTGVWLWYTERPRWQPVHVKATVGDLVAVDGVAQAVSVVQNPKLLFLLGVR